MQWGKFLVSCCFLFKNYDQRSRRVGGRQGGDEGVTGEEDRGNNTCCRKVWMTSKPQTYQLRRLLILQFSKRKCQFLQVRLTIREIFTKLLFVSVQIYKQKISGFSQNAEINCISFLPCCVFYALIFYLSSRSLCTGYKKRSSTKFMTPGN